MFKKFLSMLAENVRTHLVFYLILWLIILLLDIYFYFQL